MLQPRMTLYGMYQYDPTLFDGVTLPEGMDKTLMVNQIIRQSGDLFPYYQVPPEVKLAITEWFTRRKDNFAKLWQGFTADYNPIENYDRHEDSTETPDITHTVANNGKDITTSNGTNTETPNITHTISNSGSDNSTNTAEVQGFNGTDYTPNSKTSSEGSSSTSGTDTESGTRTTETDDNTTTTKEASGTTKESGTRTYTSRIHGNIGVTTSAQMLQGELALRQSLDIYALIAEEFETDNLIQVY